MPVVSMYTRLQAGERADGRTKETPELSRVSVSRDGTSA